MPITVPFTVMVDSGISESVPEGGNAPGLSGGPTATVRMKCLWDDHYQLIRDLLGTSVAAGSAIVRTTPFQYPPSPNLYALSVPSIEGLGKPFLSRFFPMDGRWITRKYAVCTCQFGVPPFNFDDSGPFGEPWTTVSFGVSGEFQTMPDGVYRFADGTPTTTPIGRLIPGMEINVKRYKLPYSPLAEIASVQGTLNVNDFTIASHTFSAGTLLFQGGDDEIDIDSIGNITVNVTYKFTFRPIPWNFYLKNARVTSYQIVTDGSGNPVFGLGDFAVLP